MEQTSNEREQRSNRIHITWVQRRANVFGKTSKIEAATPQHKLEITIAVLEHLENHNELTKIPINMHKMNNWMKRYPILAEKNRTWNRPRQTWKSVGGQKVHT